MLPSDGIRTFEQWRAFARPALLAELDGAGELRLPRRVMRLLAGLSCYRHDGRWELMYRLAYRILHENPRLLDDRSDPDVARARLMERAVERDCHKMHAFVRFREERRADGSPFYFAWFEPQHEILRRAVPFFTRRFPNMSWTIATPDGTAVWEAASLSFIDAPVGRAPARIDPAGTQEADGSYEVLWRAYYRSICNVSRLNPRLMQREMPRHYWRHLPEASEISRLVREGVALFERCSRQADGPGLTMAKAVQQALGRLPVTPAGPEACQRCNIWRHATQVVLGEGPAQAAIMLVGEQPGEEEDLRGRPFVGPSGHVLDTALDAAGLARPSLYITNAVKHFKWEPRGKRRLHKRPDVTEIVACNPWLATEIQTVRPTVIVALGTTALRALTGSATTIESARSGSVHHRSGARIVGTYHPAAILRTTGGDAQRLREDLVLDLKRAAAMAAELMR